MKDGTRGTILIKFAGSTVSPHASALQSDHKITIQPFSQVPFILLSPFYTYILLSTLLSQHFRTRRQG